MSSTRAFLRKVIDKTVIPFVFKRSEQPLLLRELMELNRAKDTGLKLEGRIPGAKINIGKMIIAFLLIWHIPILPISFAFHKELAQIDCHLLIFLAVIFTGMFFGTYLMFKEWLIDRVAQDRIETAWKNHLPHFAYNTHHEKVAQLYAKSLDEDIKSKDLYLYLLNNIIEKKSS